MMDIWTLLVENVFGGFWLSIVGLMVIFLIILAIGSVSSLTILEFLSFFFFAMALGYGYPLITVILFGVALYYAISQTLGYIERSGGQ